MKTALITGASSGIGKQFALVLGKKSWNLVLLARRETRLAELKAEIDSFPHMELPEISYIVCDLSVKSQRADFIEELHSKKIEIDLLINNAGFGSVGTASSIDIERQLKMVEVNCSAAMHLSCEFASQMIQHGGGSIVNVCSTASFQPIPFMATYAATKAFLMSFSLAMNEELKTQGVHVMAHCPGPTHTEFHIAAGLPEKMSFLPAMGVERVVDEVLSLLEKRRAIVTHGYLNKSLSYLARLLGPQLSARLSARVLKKYATTLPKEKKDSTQTSNNILS